MKQYETADKVGGERKRAIQKKQKLVFQISLENCN